jgi:hypothetical protein
VLKNLGVNFKRGVKYFFKITVGLKLHYLKINLEGEIFHIYN